MIYLLLMIIYSWREVWRDLEDIIVDPSEGRPSRLKWDNLEEEKNPWRDVPSGLKEVLIFKRYLYTFVIKD